MSLQGVRRWAYPIMLAAATLAIAWLWAPDALLLFLGLAAATVWASILISRTIPSGAGRTAWTLFAVVAAVPGLYVLAFGSASLANTRRLSRFSAQLFDYPVPSGSTVTSRTARVGVLVGNGDHCDFVAEMVVESSLSAQALRAHYASLRLKPAIGDGVPGEPPAIDVEEAAGRYRIVATDAPYEGILDVRCM